MRYALKIEKVAERHLEKLPAEILGRVTQKLTELEQNPRVAGVTKLKGIEGYRLRVEDYRILFTIDDRRREVCVYRVKHRREVY